MNLDVFKGSAFSLRAMTAAINARPFVPGRLGELGLFAERGISTTVAMVERRNGKLYLVPNASRGGPAAQNQTELRDAVPLKSVHLPVEDRLQADEIQDVRAFGSDSEMEGVNMKVNERLATMAASLEATKEHLRIGAIKGIVLDADGSTELYNLFDLFEITQPSEIDFDLDNATPAEGAVRKKCSQVIRGIEDALGAAPYSGIRAFCDSTFFDDLVDHPECREAYQRWMDGEALRARTARRTFFYAGINFEEYRGSVGSVNYVAAGKCHFVAEGVPDLFQMVYAPANWMQTANTIGLPLYAKQTPDVKDRWVDIDAQSNPLPYCTRPETLFRAKRT